METILTQLIKTVRQASNYNANAQEPPAAILWPDKEAQWASALPILRKSLHELFIFGDYSPEMRTGPAIWLRCIVARSLSEVEVPEDKVPVLYLPGVSRSDLRGIEHSAQAIKPLAELQFRGTVLGQTNGKDLTVNAFMTAGTAGLGLDVAKDALTQNAMLSALPQLLAEPVAHLEGRRLEATDFNDLVIDGDPIKGLLQWMNSPSSIRETWESNRWQAFCSEIKQNFNLDIEGDGEIVAAERLCSRDGKWQQVWERFCESPAQYGALPGLLARVTPSDLLADGEAYSSINANEEASLNQELESLKSLAPEQVRKKVTELEEHHGRRRQWVWAKLGQSPFALLLESLAEVAEQSKAAYGGLTPAEMGHQYREQGWRVDRAVLDCLSQCKSTQQRKIAEEILAIIYQPWLEDINCRFQQLVESKGYPGQGEVNEAVGKYQRDSELIFFIDGLRLDVAHRLMDLLTTVDIKAELRTNWSALPSVTATAKAAVSPIYSLLAGEDSDTNFEPSVVGQGSLNHHRFKKLLDQEGWQHLNDDELGDPQGLAWVACGDIDKEGHNSELKLPSRIPQILESVVERIEALLQHGWQRIRIVTDHGWLLVPGTLPKYELPKQAVESRWGRCAQLKPGVKVEGLTLPWHWNTATSIHYPPGIRSFIAGRAYAHGGVSLQECLVPNIQIVNEAKLSYSASINDIQWRGLVCKVAVETKGDGMKVDLRTKVSDASTSLAKPHPIDSSEVRLMIEDDANEGVSAVIVILDPQGTAIAKQATTVGGDD